MKKLTILITVLVLSSTFSMSQTKYFIATKIRSSLVNKNTGQETNVRTVDIELPSSFEIPSNSRTTYLIGVDIFDNKPLFLFFTYYKHLVDGDKITFFGSYSTLDNDYEQDMNLILWFKPTKVHVYIDFENYHSTQLNERFSFYGTYFK